MTSIPSSHDGLDALYFDLMKTLGEDGVTRDPQKLAAHDGDWSETARQPPTLLILPKTPQQVADALACCSRHRQPVVVQGGLTGLAGGATPQANEAALSLRRLNAIESLDAMGGTVRVQAGVILDNLQRHVEAEGWYFPLDLGARGSCQVGGNAATNAGGNRVIRYGTMRDLTLGVEVALADGRLLTMLNQVTKNTTGIELRHLFIGTEGSLGVITRLVLKLSPLPAAASTVLCALPSFEAATELLRDLRRDLPGLSAFELMWRDFMQASIAASSARPPFEDDHPVYALVEIQGTGDADERQRIDRLFERHLERGTVSDVIVAQSLDDAKRLWTYREAIGELLGRLKPRASFDVGIPIANMDTFVRSVRKTLTERFPDQHHLFFGHLGDGNLHVMTGPYANERDLHTVEAMVYQAVAQQDGSISAEHGIGVVKKPFLSHSRTSDEIAIMQDVKALLDPGGILNRGRITDAATTQPYTTITQNDLVHPAQRQHQKPQRPGTAT